MKQQKSEIRELARETCYCRNVFIEGAGVCDAGTQPVRGAGWNQGSPMRRVFTACRCPLTILIVCGRNL